MFSLVSSIFKKKRKEKPGLKAEPRDNTVSPMESVSHPNRFYVTNSSSTNTDVEYTNNKAMKSGNDETSRNINYKESGNVYRYKDTHIVNKIDEYGSEGSDTVDTLSSTDSDLYPLDDKDGHVIVREGTDFTKRYYIEKLLGQGTFGRVMKCYDRKLKRHVAIKVIRAVQKYRDAAEIEIRVLKTLESYDKENKYQCIKLDGWFDYKNHICMVFELLGPSVFDFLKFNSFRPFSINQVQEIARQLLRSVAYMHCLNMIHTDLKPENILLINSDYETLEIGPKKTIKTKILKSTKVSLIDFGSTTFDNEYHSKVVSTRHYRAPEIILEHGWTFPCDIWSIGCIIVELLVGDALFQTHENLEHLAMMEVLLGPIPKYMIFKTKDSVKTEFFRHGILNYPTGETSQKSMQRVRQMLPLEKLIDPGASVVQEYLYDLLEKMLRYDPNRRITAAEALCHKFFSLKIGQVCDKRDKFNSLSNKNDYEILNKVRDNYNNSIGSYSCSRNVYSMGPILMQSDFRLKSVKNDRNLPVGAINESTENHEQVREINDSKGCGNDSKLTTIANKNTGLEENESKKYDLVTGVDNLRLVDTSGGDPISNFDSGSKQDTKNECKAADSSVENVTELDSFDSNKTRTERFDSVDTIYGVDFEVGPLGAKEKNKVNDATIISNYCDSVENLTKQKPRATQLQINTKNRSNREESHNQDSAAESSTAVFNKHGIEGIYF
ncbi:Serine/threonine-protein kinase AFC2 [Zancudomyces culisetae]|uniref:Serine/threonine-protein kinase AFC2 n=1 Tax=Zancudomyces culisetae TaxID=1213189 RepID=A0A1R1PQD5_ZANCU|nr:Serine/threonine-protein kinase AFC2 [Zancudomyces culisetae]|eukprot:OMH83151.1 Serine/threonine-protein kinase AFC2 [Zancudomyces culisetae]